MLSPLLIGMAATSYSIGLGIGLLGISYAVCALVPGVFIREKMFDPQPRVPAARPSDTHRRRRGRSLHPEPSHVLRNRQERSRPAPTTRSRPASCRARSAGSRPSTRPVSSTSRRSASSTCSATIRRSCCSRPARHEEDGGKKDSVVNVEATGEFVYNMATWAQKDQMNQTALIVERGVDEMAAAGLEAAAVPPGAPAARQRLAGAFRVPAAPGRRRCRAASHRRIITWSSAASSPTYFDGLFVINFIF